MFKHYTLSACALAAGLLAFPTLGRSGVEATSSKEAKAAVEAPVDRRITGDIGSTVISQYISRGLVLNNQGAISQDYGDLFFDLYDSKNGFINKIQLNLSIWADLDPHSTQAGTVDGSRQNTNVPYWYEFDFLPGFTFTFLQYFTFSPSYYVFISPSNAFRTFQGLNFNFGFDDTKFLGKFALHPSFTYLREIDNKAGNGKHPGNYFEIGVTPSVPVGPTTVSFPVTAGFGSDNFYARDHGFGYVTPGVQVGVPLKFIPAAYGSYNVSAAYKFYYLGNALSNFNVGDPKVNNPPANLPDDSVRHATHFENVYSATLTVNF